MSEIRNEKHWRLRLAAEGPRGERNQFTGGPQPRPGREGGVIVLGLVEEIPPGANIHARVHRPEELIGAVLDEGITPAPAAVVSQPFKFERAPLPAGLTVSGSAPIRNRRSILRVDPSLAGRFIESRQEPAWADFLAPITGSLVPFGKQQFVLPTRGQAGDTPATRTENADLVRLRWTGTAVAGPTSIGTLGAADTQLVGVWPDPERNLVPGSITLTLPNGDVVRDDGFGRWVSNFPTTVFTTGFINYQTGIFELNFSAAPGAGSVDAGPYEHDCSYLPLDLFASWDALMANN